MTRTQSMSVGRRPRDSWGAGTRGRGAHPAAVLLSCALLAGGGAWGPSEAPTSPPPKPPNPPARAADPAAADDAPSCQELTTPVEVAWDAVRAARTCRWDGDCRLLAPPDGCATGCPASVSTDVSDAMLTRACAQHAAHCDRPVELAPADDCAAVRAICEEAQCTTAPVLTGDTGEDVDRAVRVGTPYPPHNEPGLEAAPPRPAVGSAAERAKRLLEAIRRDDPAIAKDFFLPREAFLFVKAIAEPGAYWDRLYRRYEQDIHALHESLPDLADASFERLEIIRRGGWVDVREEGNRSPYWVSRHSSLVYRANGDEHRFEVRVLITWDDEWFITHLSDF